MWVEIDHPCEKNLDRRKIRRSFLNHLNCRDDCAHSADKETSLMVEPHLFQAAADALESLLDIIIEPH